MAQKAEIVLWEQAGGWALYSTKPVGPKYAGYGLSYLSIWLETPFPSVRSSKPLLVWTLSEPVCFRKGSRWVHSWFGSTEYWGWLKLDGAEKLALFAVQEILGPMLERKLRFSPRWVLFRELERGNMGLEWVALSLLRPKLELRPGKAGFQVRLFLGSGPSCSSSTGSGAELQPSCSSSTGSGAELQPWPEGVRPLELALERFPELWLHLI